jgi:hypothetical protein
MITSSASRSMCRSSGLLVETHRDPQPLARRLSRNGAGLRALTKTWFEDSDPGYGSGDNRGSRLTTWAGRGEKFMNRGIIGTIIGVLVIIILVIVIMQMT